jgi:hypothetical protein
MATNSIEPELSGLLTKLTAEIEQDRQEMELRAKRIQKNEDLLKAIKGRLSTAGQSSNPDYGARTDAVMTAINQMPKTEFIQKDVEEAINKLNLSVSYDKQSIRNALWSMANVTHKIRLVRKGSPKEPAVYGKLPLVTRYKRVAETSPKSADQGPDIPAVVANGTLNQVSASALENAVRAKSGRIEHLAARLHTNEDAIRSLLEPASRVYVATAGWLRVRDTISPN